MSGAQETGAQQEGPKLARCVMVLGTSSGAGKSWLTTALCRWYARQGLRVAPFKAQNMSNNARVVAGGEIGSAQYFQALAAGVEPSVEMNPLLLKPEADTRSQVILLGQVNEALTAMPWRSRCQHTWPVISSTLDALRRRHDLIVIEGAGSPAEINLQATDVVNMRVARHVQAACLLVSDIDRGGAFAHLYGTWALMQPPDRSLLKGFVLNRFRGDASLLAPAPQIIEEMTGVPVVATVPMWTGHGLPEEDGWFQYRDRIDGKDLSPGSPLPPGRDDGHLGQPGRPERVGGPPDASGVGGIGAAAAAAAGVDGRTAIGPAAARMGASGDTRDLRIALVVPPRISNLDEFEPLSSLSGVQLLAVRDGRWLPGLGRQDWIILPGSKHTSSDLDWLRRQGIDRWVQAHAAAGGRVLGICGGLQMLGVRLHDPLGIDGNADGLGLLALETEFAREKVLRRRQLRLVRLTGAWSALSGLEVGGYEIHQGRTRPLDPAAGGAIGAHAGAIGAHAGAMPRPVLPDGLGWCNAAGNVLGVYLHGVFENESVLQALFGQQVRSMTTVFDALADQVGACFAPGVLAGLLD